MGKWETRPGKLTVKAIEHGPVEIVDFSIKHGDFPYVMLVYQRVCYLWNPGFVDDGFPFCQSW